LVVLLVQAAAEVTVAFNGERFPLWAIASRNPAFVFNAHANYRRSGKLIIDPTLIHMRVLS